MFSLTDFKTAWRCLASSKEQYVLRYESKYLKEMGKAMDYLYKFALNAAAHEALKYTVLQGQYSQLCSNSLLRSWYIIFTIMLVGDGRLKPEESVGKHTSNWTYCYLIPVCEASLSVAVGVCTGLLAAIAWPATLLTAASVIDNPWSVCTNRTINVGRQLADVLLSRQQVWNIESLARTHTEPRAKHCKSPVLYKWSLSRLNATNLGYNQVASMCKFFMTKYTEVCY